MAIELKFPELTRFLAGDNPAPVPEQVPVFQLPQNRRFNRKTGYAPQSQEMLAANPVTPASTGASAATAPPTPESTGVDATVDASSLSRPKPATISAPTIDFAKREQLAGDVAKYQAPLDRNDPKLKPSIWDRIIGMAVGGAMGAAGRPGEGAELGGRFTTRKMDRAEQDRTQNLNAAQSRLGEFDKEAALRHQTFGEQAEAGRLNVATAAEERGRDEYRRKVKRDEAEAKRKELEAQNTGVGRAFVGRDGKFYQLTKSGGKVEYTPKDTYEDWRLSFERDNKRPPSAKEIETYQQSVRRRGSDRDPDYNPRLASLEERTNSKVTAHKAKIDQRIRQVEKDLPQDKFADASGNVLRDEKGNLTPAGQRYFEARKKALAAIEKSDYEGMRSINRAHVDAARHLGTNLDYAMPEAWEQSNLSPEELSKILGTATPGPAPKGTAPSPVTKPSQENRVRVRDKATGKAGTIPQSQLKSAIASGKYEEL